jgi:hypothetical protein
MEILTKAAKAFVKYDRRRKVTICITDKRIYISEQAMKDFALTMDHKLVFVVDIGRLYFYIAPKESTEGFGITRGSTKCAGMVNSEMLCKTLWERFPTLKTPSNRTHPVRFSNTKINECLTFEILIDKKP